MGRPRILGKSARIFVVTRGMTVPFPAPAIGQLLSQVGLGSGDGADVLSGQIVPVGEFENFESTCENRLYTSRPMGAKLQNGQLIPGGWGFHFGGGKVDGGLSNLIQAIEDAIQAGAPTPVFGVQEIITYFGGKKEARLFPDAILYGFKRNEQGREEVITEQCAGWAPRRVRIEGYDNTVFDPYIRLVEGTVKEQVQELINLLAGSLLGKLPI